MSLVMMLCMGLPNTTHAEEPEETSRKRGNISITLNDTEDHVSKENVVLGIVKIADENAGLYDMLDPFTSSEIDLNAIETTAELNEAAIQLVGLVDEPNQTVRTASDGTAVINDLEVGVYLIYPIKLASYDHITPVIVAIPTFDDDAGKMSYDIHLEPKHYPVLTNILVKKVDANDQTKVLKFASFTLYDSDHNEIITLDTDKNGICTFEGYKRGTYYLKETKAPKGYKLSKDEIKVVIDDNYDENHIYQVTVTNQWLPAIITGDAVNLTPYILLSSIALGTGVFFFVTKKKKSSEE